MIILTFLVCFSIQTDAWFEVISVVMQMAIWHTKHAANIAASDRWVDTVNEYAGVSFERLRKGREAG